MADNESSREAQPEPSKDTLLRNMSDRDFELYIYSLRKMAENNLESNRTFMTELYNLRAFHYKTAELMLEHPDRKFAMIVLDFANFKSICVLVGCFKIVLDHVYFTCVYHARIGLFRSHIRRSERKKQGICKHF